MGDYKISATKYRPKSFEEVIGQDAVTSTLENAIKKKNSGKHCYFAAQGVLGKQLVHEF